MSKVTIFLDNTKNSPGNSPLGFNIWVGGNEPNKGEGVKVLKTDTDKSYTFEQVHYLQTWYYDFGWYSAGNIDGPFEDGENIELDQVSDESKTI